MSVENELENQSITQRKIAFAQSEHVGIAIQLLEECGGVESLLGQTEFETIVNAVTLDANKAMVMKFMSTIDRIKAGGLLNTN